MENKNKKIELYENELNRMVKQKKEHQIMIEELSNNAKGERNNYKRISHEFKKAKLQIRKLKDIIKELKSNPTYVSSKIDFKKKNKNSI